MDLASTPVRCPVLLVVRVTFIFYTTVPCNFNTPVSIDVGGKTVRISPASFNLGPVSQDSDTCIAGAAASQSLSDGELASSLSR